MFTVETKSHPGPVRVGRVHGATLSQAQAQRRAIERVTGLEAEPLIVYSRAWVDKPMARRKGVRVLPARMLASYLARRPAKLSAIGDRAGARAHRAGAARGARARPRGARAPRLIDRARASPVHKRGRAARASALVASL